MSPNNFSSLPLFAELQKTEKGRVRHEINLADNADMIGEFDITDHSSGHAQDPLYLKAGTYNGVVERLL